MRRTIRAFVLRLIGALFPRRRERELAEELESHLAFDADERMRRGLDPEEARRQAVLTFGSMELVKETYRDRRGIPALETTFQDLRYAWRLLGRNPGFALVAILTLALGIGTNTAVFRLVDAVLLARLPVRNPERLVSITLLSSTGERTNASHPLYEQLRDHEPTLEGIYATLDGVHRVRVAGPRQSDLPTEGRLQLVSFEYFDVLGVSASGGARFAPGDDRVVVVSHDFWQRRLGADRGAVGAFLRVGDASLRIVGVAPPGFFGDAVGQAPELWVPLTMQPILAGPRSYLGDSRVGWLRLMGRLREGRTLEHARESIPRTVSRLNGTVRFEVREGALGHAEFQERHAPGLRILSAIVVIVLLAACANLANLLLARARTRERELAIRLAIGAGRRRLIRQFLTEGALLAALGCVAGVLFAWWGARVLLLLLSSDGAPVPIDVSPNAKILAFAVGVAFVAAVIIALVPAWLMLYGLGSATSRGSLVTHRRQRVSTGLVIAQVVLAIVVINGAALFLRTLHNLREFDLGMAHRSLVQLEVDPEASRLSSAEVPDVSRRVLERIARLPTVDAVAAAHAGFGTGIARTCCIVVEGHDHIRGEEREVLTLGVTPGYFSAVGLPLLAGRDFTALESTTDPRRLPNVVIVNEEFVRRYVQSGSPVGRRAGWGDDPLQATYAFEIVGVAKNATYEDIRERPRPLVYFPSVAGMLFTVRAGTIDTELIAAVERDVRGVDHRLELAGVNVIADAVERTLVRERMLAALSAVLGLAIVFCASMGVYALAAHAVAARTREIGVRIALGATPGSVRRAEMWVGLQLGAVGVAVGLPLAVAAAQLVRSQMFGTSTRDPVTLGATCGLLLMLVVGASFIPARRASNVDPAVALRCD